MEKKAVLLQIQSPTLPKWSDLPEIDLYMDQVIVLMEKYLSDIIYQDSKLITSSMINNYVKLGIMPAPIKKKYSKEHLAYLIIICSLKQVVPISNIKAMIEAKLKTHSISEILDLYSEQYNSTFKSILEMCSNYLNSHEANSESLEDTSFFAAIAASNCMNISSKIFLDDACKKDKKKL